MRALLGGYLAVGVALLAIGFFATGPCTVAKKDVVGDTVFILGWPVYLYANVTHGRVSAPEWLHRQACGAGVVRYRIVFTR